MRRLLTVMVVAATTALMPSLILAGNQETADQIAQTLRASGQMHDYKIGVKYQEGTVWLKGQVCSEDQVQTAMNLVLQIDGVQRVKNELNVVPVVKPPVAEVAPAPAATPTPAPQAVETPKPVEAPTPAVAPQPVAASEPVEAPVPQVVEAPKPIEAPVPQVVEAPKPVEAPVPQVVEAPKPVEAPAPQVVEAPKPVEVEEAAPARVQLVTATQEEASPQATEPEPTEEPAPAPIPAPTPRKAANRPTPTAYFQPQPAEAPTPSAQPMPVAQPSSGAPLPMYTVGAGGTAAPARYDQPNMPGYAWPSYAAHPNYAAVTYPRQYSPAAWPYIGPFYPYPQVPLGWRKVTLQWDDGWWFLDFKDH